MTDLVQITQRSGRANRVPEGQAPTIELDLEPHQQVVQLELRELNAYDVDRKTRDWTWTVTVATRIKPRG